MNETRTLDIVRLGAFGDGIAAAQEGDIFVAGTLPGERVVADVEDDHGRLVEVLSASPDRAAPACPHFGTCGACALQHMAAPAYLAWKQEHVRAAFASRGLDAPVDPVIAAPLADRRRATLTARRPGANVLLGFHAARSSDVVDIRACSVLTPRLLALLPRLREFLHPLLSRRAEARVNMLDAENGVDLAISGIRGDLTAEARAGLASRAAGLGIVRLAVEKDIVLQIAEPVVRLGGAAVVPPPGAFLQASAAAEAAMTRLVVDAAGKSKRVADLFCGLGTFALPLARKASVTAVESDKHLADALRSAAKRNQGLKPIEAKVRDLYHEPLAQKELEPFDAVVFDPPHAGAKAQAEALARSKVRTVVAVSCNPATLARDAQILVDGGYRIERVSPIDQFLFSTEIEVVAVLRR